MEPFKSFTPSDGKDEQEASLFFEGVCQQPVEVVAFAEHPGVVGQPEVHRQHQQESAATVVLEKRRNQGEQQIFVGSIDICLQFEAEPSINLSK